MAVPHTRTPMPAGVPPRVAALLRADRRARLLARDIAAGLKPDMGADGPAATARPVEVARVALAPGAPAQAVRRLRDGCMLDRLFHRANAGLSAAQHEVGLRFRRYWLRSTCGGRLVQRYSPHTGPGAGGVMEETEAAVHARAAIDRALALLTPARARAVCAVCGMDEHPGTRTRTLRSALDVLDERWR
ncbi:hypothetical protein DY926_12655 [Komagataeibacter melaceti]|uniref:Uncharacterized protein n=1 Tax=Komagataeibacter melaceti TaxID=2766577 RepID=A0A371YY63_9PROT|nr:hypothetical protein [Komagataeibacter melaceti]RFD19175.1 hypothetical protein DY926_12655 [Komagataeibacter melaceti]